MPSIVDFSRLDNIMEIFPFAPPYAWEVMFYRGKRNGEQNLEVQLMMHSKNVVRFALAIMLAVFLALPNMACAYDESAMAALKPIPEGKAFFDMNTTLMSSEMFPMVLMGIVQTHESLVAQGIKPDFVVSFRGANVVWLTEGTSDTVKGLIAQLDALGVKIDLCRIPLEWFGVDPTTVLPQIKIIDNGWVSSMSYQSRSKGYAVISF